MQLSFSTLFLSNCIVKEWKQSGYKTITETHKFDYHLLCSMVEYEYAQTLICKSPNLYVLIVGLILAKLDQIRPNNWFAFLMRHEIILTYFLQINTCFVDN